MTALSCSRAFDARGRVHVHLRGDTVRMELEGVGDQVLEQLAHLEWACRHGGKPTHDHAPMARPDPLVKVGEHLGHDLAQIHRLRRLRSNRHLRVLQEIGDQGLHPARGTRHPAEVVLRLLIERAR